MNDCSEVRFSKLERTLRLDSEFYSNTYSKLLHDLSRLKSKPLTQYVSISDGNHMGISDSFINDGIPYYRGQDIHNFFIENSSPICIDKEIYNNKGMIRSHLNRGDVLLSIVGTIGEVALVTSDQSATCNCKLAILRPNNINDSFIIALYLKSIYGQKQIKRLTRGAVQMGLILDDMDQLYVPRFSKQLIASINLCKEKIELLNSNYTKFYNKAKKQLYDTLEVEFNKFDKSHIYVKSSINTIFTTNRMDAEYFLPKYDDLFASIKTCKNYKLQDIVNIKKSVEPGSDAYRDEGIPFVRVQDMTKFGISNPAVFLDYTNELDKYFIKKDEILFSKDGTVGIAFKAMNNMNAVTSGAILHLQIKNKKELLPNYLTLVLNSNLVQLQAERDAGGSIISHWHKDNIENILIPVLDFKQQRKISNLIEKSFKYRNEYSKLIKDMINAVEIYISKDEKTALKYINQFLEKGVNNA